jgi:hypothetical protein
MAAYTFQNMRKKVLTYAKRKRLIKPIKKMDERVKTDFLLLLAVQGLIPDREPLSMDVVIEVFWNLFFDWYFFERDNQGKSIAEVYVESENFKKDFPGINVKEVEITVQKMKSPLWGYFFVCGKGEKDEYTVKQFEKESIYRIHDASTFPYINRGNLIFTKVYPFGDLYYVSGSIQVYPGDFLKEYKKVKAVKDGLDTLFEEFMQTKKVKKTAKYEDMYFMLSEYIAEKWYTTMEWVDQFDVDTWAEWIRRQWEVSRSEEDECRSAIKQFLKFAKKEKEKIRNV